MRRRLCKTASVDRNDEEDELMEEADDENLEEENKGNNEVKKLVDNDDDDDDDDDDIVVAVAVGVCACTLNRYATNTLTICIDRAEIQFEPLSERQKEAMHPTHCLRHQSGTSIESHLLDELEESVH